MTTQRTESRIALVTGANKGIGFETSRQLAKQGVTVLLGARNEARGQAAERQLKEEGLDVRFVLLDVTDQTTMTAVAKQFEADYGKLDILVNNAGINAQSSGDGPPSTAEEAALRQVFEVNVFGTFKVTKALLPLLKKAEAARIVNVSSGLASLTLASDHEGLMRKEPILRLTGYNTSKAALNMLTIQLAAEVQDTPIKVNAVEPGYTATDLNGFQGTQTVEEGAAAQIKLALLPNDGPTAGFFSRDGVVPW